MACSKVRVITCVGIDEALTLDSNEQPMRFRLVKGLVTYMVMDDLDVKPMSTISSIALLNTFNVKDVRALEEKQVTLGMKEALKLLKLSLESDKVLTELFC